MKQQKSSIFMIILDMTIMYLLVVLGVFASKWLGPFRAGETIVFGQFQWGNMALTLIIAFAQLSGIELTGKQNNDAKLRVKAWTRRASAALFLGIGWHTLIGG